jgi:carboxymethylenebutenolidase
VAPYGDLPAAARYFQGMTDDGVAHDISACVDHLIGLGFPRERIGVIGFCFGGRAAFLAAVRQRLGAVVTLYGGGIVKASTFLPFPSLLDDISSLQTPWLGLYGADDHGIPADEVDALEAALAEQAPIGIETEIVRYEGAGHAFHNDQLPSYHPEAASAAWQRSLDWLATHGVTAT